MSKLYEMYLKLKSNQKKKENTLYLFKSGIFFIFIDEDAKIASQLFHLKLTPLNEKVMKCGFPSNSITKYHHLFDQSPYQVKIVSTENQKEKSMKQYLLDEHAKEMIEKILTINIDSLSISEAYDFLYFLQKEFSSWKEDTN